MPSKRSFFNLTLFQKNLSRSWPLWGGVTAVGCLAPLYVLLTLLNRYTFVVDQGDFTHLLYSVSVYFVPAASFGYAAVVAMVVWSYQYSARSVGLMHTLPIHRDGLFVTGVLSGLAMLLIPYASVGFFTCLLGLCWGFMSVGAVLATVAAVLLMTVLFFGMATFCAMMTGNIFALPAFYVVLNFAAPALDVLVGLLSRNFLVGVSTEYTGAVEFLSPLIRIYQNFHYEHVYAGNVVTGYVLTGFGTVVIYGLVGLGFFALAWLLYRRRESESAGNLVAFRWLRPVFRYGVALVFALTSGHALYALIWGSIFQRGDYAQALPMAVSMALTGLVGYYGASMLLDKSLRVFRGSAPGAAAVVVAAAVICAGVRMDLFGAERYVPEAENIETVYIYTSEMMGHTPDISAEESPEMVERVLALHSAITERVDELRAADERPYTESVTGGRIPDWSRQHINIHYTLKDGSEVRRSYQVYLTRDNWERNAGIEGAFKGLFAGTEIQLYQVQPSRDAQLHMLHVYCYANGHASNTEGFELDEHTLYQALLTDAQEGNLYDYNLFDDYYNDNYPVTIDLQFRQQRDEGGSGLYNDYYNYDYRSLELRPTMVHTIANLLAQGFLTEEDLTEWNESYGIPDKYARLPRSVGVY